MFAVNVITTSVNTSKNYYTVRDLFDEQGVECANVMVLLRLGLASMMIVAASLK